MFFQTLPIIAWKAEATNVLRQLLLRAAKEARGNGGIGSQLVTTYRTECFKLLKEDANPNVICDYGGHSLIMAGVYNRDLSFIRTVVECGADPNVQEDYSPLNEAVRTDQYNIVHFLLGNNADPNRSMQVDPELSPLGALVHSIGHHPYTQDVGSICEPKIVRLDDAIKKMAKLLLDHGADPVQMQKCGKTPLRMLQEIATDETRAMLQNMFNKKIESDLEGCIVHE